MPDFGQRAPARFEGRCLCGDVTIVAEGNPEGVAGCHCQSCRRHTGAPFAIYADYRTDRVTLTGTYLVEYRSSPEARRGFCGRCGSTIYYRGDNLPDMIHLHVGVFNNPELFAPTSEECVDERLSWLDH